MGNVPTYSLISEGGSSTLVLSKGVEGGKEAASSDQQANAAACEDCANV